MQRHILADSVIGRLLFVALSTGFALLLSVVSASATTVKDPTDGAALSPGTPSVPTIVGVSIGTIVWVSIGLLILIVGFVAASKSGYRAGNVGAGASSPRSSADLGAAPVGARESHADLGKAALAAS